MEGSRGLLKTSTIYDPLIVGSDGFHKTSTIHEGVTLYKEGEGVLQSDLHITQLEMYNKYHTLNTSHAWHHRANLRPMLRKWYIPHSFQSAHVAHIDTRVHPCPLRAERPKQGLRPSGCCCRMGGWGGGKLNPYRFCTGRNPRPWPR